MSEVKENKPAEKIEQAPAKDKTLPVVQVKEKSALEKAAETISGDNKLMDTVLKVLLSPISLLVSAGLIVYGYLEIKKQKAEIENLKSENKKLADEKKELEEDYGKVKKKYKKMKELHEPENNLSGLLPQQKQLAEPTKNKMYHSTYLD
ncbi:MAG: hypothetical protein ACYDCN_05310 [Bacteroidia bacterium]